MGTCVKGSHLFGEWALCGRNNTLEVLDREVVKSKAFNQDWYNISYGIKSWMIRNCHNIFQEVSMFSNSKELEYNIL